MSTWKDFIKTPKKMSKPKESKSNTTRRKLNLENSQPEPDHRQVKDEDSATSTDGASGPEGEALKPKPSTRSTTKATPTDQDPDEEVDEKPGDATFKVVSHKKKVKKPVDYSGLFTKFCDESLYTKKGIIFNFLNNQCHGTSQYVRALRISLEDPTHLDRYLAANLQSLKTTAAFLVHDYFLLSRVNFGQSEDLTIDEYSPSFTFATLSEEGRSLLPNGEEEGPIWFSMFPNLLKKTKLRTLPDGSPDEAYVINFRLHQVNPNIRIRTQLADDIAPIKGPRKGGQYTTIVDPSSKKSGNFIGPRTGATITPPPIKVSKPYNQARSRESQEALAIAQEARDRSLNALHYSQEAHREVASLKTEKNFPILPDLPAPKWSDQVPTLPDTY